eukprot:TRINITY_DN11646_c0_g1_i1.p1 TRINITY_DN11646_c0_g1~~TRINITY_DN11646_c0_g1_i1.p1  ORF type:complete len:144 (+),score=11.69 TRINITY_DN11646_c0_g1_i1:319-750(+)
MLIGCLSQCMSSPRSHLPLSVCCDENSHFPQPFWKSDVCSQPAPMLTIRHKHVLEASQTLLDRFDGRFSNVIKLANGSAQELVRLVLEHFPTFRDISPWKGKQGEADACMHACMSEHRFACTQSLQRSMKLFMLVCSRSFGVS